VDCAQCGEANRDGARFCGECGARLANLGELGAAVAADSHPQSTDRSATRWARRLNELINEGNFDEVAEMYAVDVVAVDRRSVVSVPILRGRAAIRENLEALHGVGLDRVSGEVLAVRGDRLVLQRIVFSTADGREMRTLGLNEWDNGEVVRRVVFDEDALDDAFAELDDRYHAGENASQGTAPASATPPPTTT
jgi:ketosteroid isomerase-like protein